MTALFARLTNWLYDERGDMPNFGGSTGLLLTIVLVLAAIALLVYLFGPITAGD